MSNPLIQFDFDGRRVRALSIEDQPWFCLKDVCDVLEILNPSITNHKRG